MNLFLAYVPLILINVLKRILYREAMNGPQKLNLEYAWQLLTYMHQMLFIIVFVIQILKLVRRNHNYIQMRHQLKKEKVVDL